MNSILGQESSNNIQKDDTTITKKRKIESVYESETYKEIERKLAIKTRLDKLVNSNNYMDIESASNISKYRAIQPALDQSNFNSSEMSAINTDQMTNLEKKTTRSSRIDDM